jgi:FixJ family two-component response regulator
MVRFMGAGDCEIIVVDDDAGMSRAIERLLMTSGWKARSFPSAEEFLASDSVDNVGILILDIQLPGMSGLDLHKQLAAAGIRPPAIFITAHDHPFLREKAELAGAVAYFTKPFEGQLLIDAVRRHLKAA